MHTEAHLFSVPNDCLWYDKLWGPSQRVVTLLQVTIKMKIMIKSALNVFHDDFNYCDDHDDDDDEDDDKRECGSAERARAWPAWHRLHCAGSWRRFSKQIIIIIIIIVIIVILIIITKMF